MLSSRFFSFLAFAAVVVAENFPSGEFLISNVESQLVLKGGFGNGHPITVSDYHEGDYTQVWSYTNGTGFLKNKGSGLVIEVPRTNEEIKYGTVLVQATPRNEANDDLVQLWDYDEHSHHLFTLAEAHACITGNSSEVPAMVDYCDSNGGSYGQQWEFIPL